MIAWRSADGFSAKQHYQVAVVRPQGEFAPGCWRDMPVRFRVLFVPLVKVQRWSAMSWARAFNRRELEHPSGVWAVVIPCQGIHFPCPPARFPQSSSSAWSVRTGVATPSGVEFD